MQEVEAQIIQGSVANILNERELVINRGAEQGIRDGMKFRILEETYHIVDPETNESLGSMTREKIRVKIVDVRPKFSVGRTYETFPARTPSHFLGLLQTPTVRKIQTINTPGIGTEPFDDSVGYVNIGDKVIQIHED
ncbi:MAG: hypothetical protein OXI16_14100 [Chloroflexota bacterium]|nr:hypothetical protein [Chloroflexota bacterium]